MKTPRNDVLIMVVGVALYCVPVATPAAPFVNLDFENVITPLEPIDPVYGRVSAANAYPGWNTFIGPYPEPLIAYNTFPYSAAGIALFGPGSGPFAIIEGQYTAWLGSGPYLEDIDQILDGTISQVGDIPANAKSITLWAFVGSTYVNYGFFSVSIGGHPIEMFPLETQELATLYGGDISAYAGQTAELRINSLFVPPFEENGYSRMLLDAIEFSNQPIPEPSTWALVGLGLLLLPMEINRRHRRSESRETR